jgi:uncharacterized protein
MKIPFEFGKIVSGDEFTGRENETELLERNFESGINTVIISPGRLGKSSLVLKAAEGVKKKNPKIIFCFIDLFNVRNEEEFYHAFARNIILSSSLKISEVMETVKRFLGKFSPKISFGADPMKEFSLSLDWKGVIKNPDGILDLPEKICISGKKKIVICIDEFQNACSMKNSSAFLKKLRSHWQKHKSVSYCLCGSKKNIMPELFTNPSMPFYKFGEIVYLNKIEVDDWKKFIIKRFNDTGKTIDEETALEIISLADCHSCYIQQLAQQCWLRTEKYCSLNIVSDSFINIMNLLEYQFRALTSSLTITQVNFLKAIVNEEKQFSSKDVIWNYSLGTSANVLRIKTSLSEKEIIDIKGSEITLQDPVYKIWLKENYFG